MKSVKLFSLQSQNIIRDYTSPAKTTIGHLLVRSALPVAYQQHCSSGNFCCLLFYGALGLLTFCNVNLGIFRTHSFMISHTNGP
jgi:hypothetical protein